MNRQDQQLNDQLPSPGSPRHLDQQILARARANVPDKSTHWRPGWGSGLATAAVLVVGVYLTQLTRVEQATLPAAPSAAYEEVRTQSAPAPKAKRERAASMAFESPPMAAEAEMAAGATADLAEGAARKAMPASLAADSEQDIESELRRFKALVEDGQREQAEAEYARLRQDCPDCGLQPTLQQALDSMKP